MNTWYKLSNEIDGNFPVKKPKIGETIIAFTFPLKLKTKKGYWYGRGMYLVKWYEGRENEGSDIVIWTHPPELPEEVKNKFREE